MNLNNGLSLVAPRIVPVLDAQFRPAVLANRAYREQVAQSGKAQPVTLALEQTDGPIYHFKTAIFAEDTPQAAANYVYLERILKFLLWSRGGWRIYFDGPRRWPPSSRRITARIRPDSSIPIWSGKKCSTAPSNW